MCEAYNCRYQCGHVVWCFRYCALVSKIDQHNRGISRLKRFCLEDDAENVWKEANMKNFIKEVETCHNWGPRGSQIPLFKKGIPCTENRGCRREETSVDREQDGCEFGDEDVFCGWDDGEEHMGEFVVGPYGQLVAVDRRAMVPGSEYGDVPAAGSAKSSSRDLRPADVEGEEAVELSTGAEYPGSRRGGERIGRWIEMCERDGAAEMEAYDEATLLRGTNMVAELEGDSNFVENGTRYERGYATTKPKPKQNEKLPPVSLDAPSIEDTKAFFKHESAPKK